MTKIPAHDRAKSARSSQQPPSQLRVLTPIKAIRCHCMDCSGGSRKEVATCHVVSCPLWPYRLGKRPCAEELQKREGGSCK